MSIIFTKNLHASYLYYIIKFPNNDLLKTKHIAVPSSASSPITLTSYGFGVKPSDVFSVEISNNVGTVTELRAWFYESSTGKLHLDLKNRDTNNVRLTIIYN